MSGSGESRCPKMTDLHQTASDQTCPRIDLRIGWASEDVLWLVGKPASCSRTQKSSIFELGPETGNPSIQRLDVLLASYRSKPFSRACAEAAVHTEVFRYLRGRSLSIQSCHGSMSRRHQHFGFFSSLLPIKKRRD